MIWFTADWHFGHRNILTLGQSRPFATIEEHDEALVERHNALVAPDDTVWVLGDVAMGDIATSLARCQRMNGHKILVCGNHDRPENHADVPERRDRWAKRYEQEGGFMAVVVLIPPVRLDKLLPGLTARVRLSHYPYTGESDPSRKDRYADRRPFDQGDWLLHGHVHHAWRVNGRQINVGVDAWDYKPVSINQISELIQPQNQPRS